MNNELWVGWTQAHPHTYTDPHWLGVLAYYVPYFNEYGIGNPRAQDAIRASPEGMNSNIAPLIYILTHGSDKFSLPSPVWALIMKKLHGQTFGYVQNGVAWWTQIQCPFFSVTQALSFLRWGTHRTIRGIQTLWNTCGLPSAKMNLP